MADSLLTVRLMGFDRTGSPLYYQTYNLSAARSLNTHRLWPGGGSELNLNGEGITLNVWDGGSIRHTHQEFGGRTQQMDGDPIMSGHATHVAGTMVAAGLVANARGMAPAARLHVYDFDNDEAEMTGAAAAGAILSNHSYGRPTGWLFHLNQWWWYGDTRVSEVTDYKFGFYSHETRIRDEITYLAPFYLQVHAAGNDRLDTGPEEGEEHNVFDHDLGIWVKSTNYREPDGGSEGYDCISTLVLGKNVITVGSVHDVEEYTGPESVELSEFSSTGPADDGRIKPDVVANGQSLLSTWVDSNSSYAGLTGTSMAAPTVTASLGLIQQLNKYLYGNTLRAATLKALMIHTAREAGDYPGPDYRHGWGLADMDAAAGVLPGKGNTTLVEERNLVQDIVPVFSRTVYSTGQSPLIATLSWTDVPGTPPEPALNDRTPMLVNDLDLRLIRLSDGVVFYPWKLDPVNPSAPATRGDNLVDNVEKIEIQLPEPGEYLIEVSHKGEIADLIHETNKRQPFSLVVSGIAERNIDLAITNARILDGGCHFSSHTPALIMLANKGRQDANQIDVAWEVTDPEGLLLQTDTVLVGFLGAGTDTILEVFPDLTLGLEFLFSASVNYPGDQLPANNSYTREVVSENWLVSEHAFHTGFEGISFIEDINWSVVNANQNASSWALRLATSESQWASEGFNAMRYGTLNPADDGVETMEDADDWLITSCFYLLKNEHYRLGFDYRSWGEEYPESMRVMLGRTDEPGGFDTELIDLQNFATDAYESGQSIFEVPEDGTYFIAFHIYSPADHRFVYLDNVSLERMVYADLAATGIVVEAEGCDFSYETPVRVTYANRGLNPQEEFPVELRVIHPGSGREDVLLHQHEGSLEPGGVGEHEFSAPMDIHGIYRLELTIKLPGDENPENDTLTVEIVNTSVDLALENYFTNFDEINSLEELGWSLHSNSPGSTGWRLNNLAGQAYSRPQSLNMYRFGGDPDDWAITNCFFLEEGRYYRIKFYTATRGTNTEEYFSLHLMDEALPGAAIQRLGGVYVRTFDYVKEEIVFQAPYSGEFHIGLYTDFTGPDTFQIFVDDFAVEAVLPKDAAAVGIVQQTYGCGAFTSKTPVQVVIENKGFENLEEAGVELRIESQGRQSLLYSLQSEKTLALAERDTLQFHVDLSRLNTLYTLTAEVLAENDGDASNNFYSTRMRNTTVDLAAGQSYFNDFEMVDIDGHSDLVDPRTGWWYENTNEDYSSGGSPITWVMRKNAPFARSGEVSMRSGRSLENAADDWLFSNCFIMRENENYLLSFYYTGRTSSAEEKMSVYLGDAQTSEAMEQKVWHRTFRTGLDYRRGVAVVSPPADGIYYVGFHAHSEADQGWIYLDDFGMEKNHDVDISLDGIEVMADACQFDEYTPVRITYRNSGNKELSHPVTIAYEIVGPHGQPVVSAEEVIAGPMQVGQRDELEVLADMRSHGLYTINASARLPEGVIEAETANNTRSLEVFGTAMNPVAEDIYITFENFDNIDQTGWRVYDANADGYSWDLGVNFTTFAFSGNRVMYYSYNEHEGADDWLFSSCAHLESGKVYKAGFYYRVYDADYSERLHFGIADEPHPSSVIRMLDTKEEMVNYNYRKLSVAFTVEEDGQYYFAWHALSDQFRRYVFIDDFILKEAGETDGGVYSIEPLVHGCAYDDQTPMQAVVSNLGSGELPKGALELHISGPGGTQSLSLPTPRLGVKEQAEVHFVADLSHYGRYVLQYDLQIEGDQDRTANAGSFHLFAHRIALDRPGNWFVQNFASVLALRDLGWTIHNVNMDNRYWGLRVNDPSLARSGRNYLVYFMGNVVNDADDWVISGCYELEGGRQYKAAYFYRLGSGYHNIRLAMGAEPLPESMDLVVWEGSNMISRANDTYRHMGGLFEVAESGRYHFGIHQFSRAGQGSSLADDLVVIARPDIIPPDAAVEAGSEIVITALGTDSLRWFSDPGLNRQIGQGQQLTYAVGAETSLELYAAEVVYGIKGPADTLRLEVTVGTGTKPGVTPLTLYPNPAAETLHVLFPGNLHGTLRLQLLNLMGEELHSAEMTDAAPFTLDVSGLSRGAYIVVVQHSGGRLTARFIKL